MAEENFEGLRGARLFHLVSPSLQISLVGLPGPVPGLCVGVGLLVSLLLLFFACLGEICHNLNYFQLLTDHVSY